MLKIVTVGLDLTKNVFQRTQVGRCFARSRYGIRFLSFSVSCQPASLRWKPVAGRISGAARLESPVTTFGSSRPPA